MHSIFSLSPSFSRMASITLGWASKSVANNSVGMPSHTIIVPCLSHQTIALAKLGHPSSSTSTMYHSEDCVVSHSITCSSDPFFRDVAVRKLAVVGRQCEKNNKNRARTSGKCTLEHIQSTALTDNYTKSYPKFPWAVSF